MSITDFVIIGIFVVSIIIGVIRGFWKTFSKVLVLIISLCLGFLLASTLAPAIFNDSALGGINSFFAKFIGTGDVGAGTIIEIGNEYFVKWETAVVPTMDNPMKIEEALKLMLVPSFMHAPIIASASSIVGEMTLGALVCSAYTHWISIVLCGGIVFIVSAIILTVVSAIIQKMFNKKHFMRAADRVLGGVFRIFTASIFVLIVFQIIGMMSGFEFMQPVMADIEKGAISGPVFNADLFNKLFYGEGMSKLVDQFKNLIVSVPAGGAESASIILSSLV